MLEFFKSLFAAKPPVTLLDPRLGLLTCERGSEIWSGEARSAGRLIRFFVAGDDSGPDARLLGSLNDTLGRFVDVERDALDFLVASADASEQASSRLFGDERPSIGRHEFAFYAVDFLWEHKPLDFVMEFTLEGDVDGIWRVEFENGSPKSLGRDD